MDFILLEGLKDREEKRQNQTVTLLMQTELHAQPSQSCI